MSLKTSHVLNFAQRILTILKSCLVAAPVKANNPFSRPSSADVLGEMRPFELEEQLVPFDSAVCFSEFGMMTQQIRHLFRHSAQDVIGLQ